jgi:hypothetical protein
MKNVKNNKYKCEFCNKEYLRKSSQKGKFCSLECFHENRRGETSKEVVCENCNKKFRRSLSKIKRTKYNFNFCSNKCKGQAQSLSGNCPEIRAFGVSGKRICERLKSITDVSECVDCNENRDYMLCVHHIDGNPKNNPIDGSNWEIVCRNCHRKRHLVKKNEGWVYNTKFLTPRHLLKTL